MSRILLAYMKDTNGATSIEYAVIAALVSIVILGALLEIGPMVESQFEQVNTGFDQAQYRFRRPVAMPFEKQVSRRA